MKVSEIIEKYKGKVQQEEQALLKIKQHIKMAATEAKAGVMDWEDVDDLEGERDNVEVNIRIYNTFVEDLKKLK